MKNSAKLFEFGIKKNTLKVGFFTSAFVHLLTLLILFLFFFKEQKRPFNELIPVTVILSTRVVAPPTAMVEPKRPSEPERPKPVVTPPSEAPKPLQTRPDSAPSAIAPRVAEPPPVQQAGAPPSSSPSVPSSAPAQRAPEVQAPPVSAGPNAALRPAESADTGNLDQYRIALLGAANRYKRYPAIALEKGWQGRVEVLIVIGANGMTQSITVKTSSGFEILDKAAIEMVTKGKGNVLIPPSLRGREFTVPPIPVIFSMQKD